MDKIKVSLDYKPFWGKPEKDEIPEINSRIGKSVKELKSSPKDIRAFAERVGIEGQTFCPASFKEGCRKQEKFEQQQFFALDFDNKEDGKRVSFEEVRKRADHYELPILFAYDTFSSTEHNKFRVVFLNDASISDRKVAEAMQLAMGTIFPEADSTCYKDVSKMYFGGKELLYYDKEVPLINVESVFRNLSYYLKDTYHAKHYKEKIQKFSKETGISLNKKGFFDVTVVENPTEECFGAKNNQNTNGGNAPSAIIYTSNYIKGNGAIPPKVYYKIILDNDCTKKLSVAKNTVSVNHSGKHSLYRSSIMESIRQKCRLFSEFENGKRELCHNELFGLLNNLLNIDSGEKIFKDGLAKYPYANDKIVKWERHCKYNKQQGYRPMRCDNFCPYCDECCHGKNILTTAHQKHGTMEKLPDSDEEFFSLEEVQEDTYQAIRNAFYAPGTGIHVIKSMTAAGKTTSYVKIMNENHEERFLISAPTNLLKDEIYERAKKIGIDVRRTPSLEQIKDKIPDEVWRYIQHLYSSGHSNSVHAYIKKVLEKRNIPCLSKYMEEREKLRNYHGNVITTHRYLLNMSRERLSEYDAVIIDEDIIFKSIISNQCEISKTKLHTLSKSLYDSQVSAKIKRLLKLSDTKSCIELDGFEPDKDSKDDIPKETNIAFDISSFCKAEKFYVCKASKDNRLEDDMIYFLKPAMFQDIKYIMVSATANERICCDFFGADKVDFYQCKRAAYQGTLHQYPQKSMSRTSMANNLGIASKLMERFGINEDKVITFKKENIGKLHFGNTEGSNTLEGKNLLVIGTPYHADFMYKLAAFTIGLNFDETEDMESLLVTHNGYRFWFTTYKNENLRAVQFWMIESELEQAVGRARLLRNPCEVYLFSNFPLSQAEMIEDFDFAAE